MPSLLSSLIRNVIPGDAGVGQCSVKELHASPVPPELRQLGSDVTPKRRLDFCLGRIAARQALEAIGVEGRLVPRGDAGQPIWPAGVVGSISHSGGVAVAVVLRATAGGIGVDLELRPAPLSQAAQQLALTTHERRWIASESGNSWPLILFSAKEAAYKALPAAVSRELGFHDVEFDRDEAGSLTGASLQIPPHMQPHARYVWTPTLLLTTVATGFLP